ncbi:MAG: hypothetical protein V7L20_14365 [Nostoc sp.]|uniref:hypothetical protein n=1 Tax=Nostoc sp. TaxID=1180 RepID=UPI002FF52719
MAENNGDINYAPTMLKLETLSYSLKIMKVSLICGDRTFTEPSNTCLAFGVVF